MISRRQFLKFGAATAAGLALSTRTSFDSVGRFSLNPGRALAYYQGIGLQKFVQPLRGVGPGGIPVAAPDSFRAPVTGAVHYSLFARQFEDRLHPDLGATRLWGYQPAAALGGGIQPQRHLGGIIVAQRGTPIQLTFTNRLPPTHILPVDRSSSFPDVAGNYGNRTAAANAMTVHLHGGLVPWISDGGPDTWFDPNGHYGPSAKFGGRNIYRQLNPFLLPGQGEYYYPNNQSARLVWYHDHAHDITRLNAYAGLASAYIIRDSFEGNLRNLGLPDFIENSGREIPIAIQEKVFVDAQTIATLDPSWPGPRSTGSLWYPHVYEPDHWDLGPSDLHLPDVSCIPEMFGDTMLANGTVYPEATVEARRYRLRILNATQARFLNLQLYVDDGTADSITLRQAGTLPDGTILFNPTNAKGPDFLVIGTEAGFLRHPVLVPSNIPFFIQQTAAGDPIPSTIRTSLLTAPAERWDVIVDFSGYAGKKIILYNDAPAPFPSGMGDTDHFPGNPADPNPPVPGFGPNTRQIMRFNVVGASSKDPALRVTTATDLSAGIDKFLVPPAIAVLNGKFILPPGARVRQLTLDEDFDEFGRLLQRLGTDVRSTSDQTGTLTNGLGYMDPCTETPRAGATEVWQITNLTADTHPIHFHLCNVQVLGRQTFDGYRYGANVGGPGAPLNVGPARRADPLENGWKETVKMHPGEITTVIMKFDLPAHLPFSVPSSPMGGHEFVWHCHILEHEEHDMMRPLMVT